MERLIALAVFGVLVRAGRGLFRTWFNPITLAIAPFLVILLLQEVLMPSLPFAGRGSLILIGSLVLFSLGALWAGTVCGAGSALQPLTVRARGGVGRHIGMAHAVLAGVPWAVVLLQYHLIYQLQMGRGVEGFVREDFLAAVTGSGWIGAVYRVLQMLMYVVAIPLSLYFLSRGPGSRAAYATYFVGVAGASLLTVAKMGFLTVAVVSICTCGFVRAHRWSRISGAPGRSMVAAGGALVLLVIVTMGLRYGTAGVLQKWFVRRLLVAAIGGPSAFAALVSDPTWNVPPAGLGVSLGGLRELLGMRVRDIGVYGHMLLGSTVDAASTNIFTALRFMLEDLGVVGLMGLMFSIGAIQSILQIHFLRRPTPLLLSVLTAGGAWCLWLPVTTLTYYNFWYVVAGVGFVIGRWYVIEPHGGARTDPIAAGGEG